MCSINKNSVQYKAVERDYLNAVIANEVSKDWCKKMFDMASRYEI